jgi:hypothetical protein
MTICSMLSACVQLDSIKDLKEKPLDKMLSAEHKSILELAVHQAESYSDGVQMTAMVEALGNRLQGTTLRIDFSA